MDKYDKAVLRWLDECGPLTLRGLVGRVFDVTDHYAVKKKSNCLRYRLEKLVSGEIAVYDRKSKMYSLVEYDVGHGMMILTKLGGEQLGLDTGNTMFVHLTGGGDRVIFLDD